MFGHLTLLVAPALVAKLLPDGSLEETLATLATDGSVVATYNESLFSCQAEPGVRLMTFGIKGGLREAKAFDAMEKFCGLPCPGWPGLITQDDF